MPLVRVDLAKRQEAMGQSALAFLRGSFYWWAERWPALCPELQDVPAVFGVGDLHVENFGTWRAVNGTLIWGVNDFDEAAVVPYTNDLVRLATSALLASGKNSFGMAPKATCNAILTGYRASFERGGEPIKLSARREWAQSVLSYQDRRIAKYWRELFDLPSVHPVDPVALRALKRALPPDADELRVVHRQGGLGSLGRQRFTSLATAQEEPVAREAKRLTASAWAWRKDGEAVRRSRYAELLQQAVRCADPSLRLWPRAQSVAKSSDRS